MPDECPDCGPVKKLEDFSRWQWAVCNHALAGEPIKRPYIPLPGSVQIGSIVCKAMMAKEHSVDDIQFYCGCCIRHHVPGLAEYFPELEKEQRP